MEYGTHGPGCEGGPTSGDCPAPHEAVEPVRGGEHRLRTAIIATTGDAIAVATAEPWPQAAARSKARIEPPRRDRGLGALA